jgi:DNA-binding transcriptional LysR family regulator
MELRQLRHFQEIVRCASFGQAAERMNITQPALSKSIRNLEQELKVQLLERHPGGVVPTDYGRVLLQYAALVISELDRAVEELAEMRGAGKGVVRVGAGTSLLQVFLPHVVRAFVQKHPEHAVTVSQGLKAALFAMLRRGEIDLVVSSIEPDRPDPDVLQERLFEDRLTVVANQSHPLVGVLGVSFASMAGFAWVLPDASEAEGSRLLRAFKTAGEAAPRVAVRTASSLFMASVLRDADYLSYLPRALLRTDPDYAHLRALDTAPIWRDVFVGVSYRRKGVMLPQSRRFITQLKEAARQLDEDAVLERAS